MSMRLLVCRLVMCVGSGLLVSSVAMAGDPSLAPAPPMGWNSWDAYGQTVNEKQVRANAEWMARHLKSFGWSYVVIDEGWYIENPEASDPKDFRLVLGEDGRFLPDVRRFPSAANGAGFGPLSKTMHALGLKLGVHMLRGIPREAVAKNLPIAGSTFHAAEAADTSDTCPWNIYNYGVKDAPAGQAYYESVMKLYAGWGVDFVKVDCIADHPYKPAEIRMINAAIRKSGRPMVLSLSPGPTALDKADEVARYAEMWRICDDFWDHWGTWAKHEWSQGLLAQFATTAKWAPHVASGSWPDADMLPLGHLGPSPGAGEVRESRFTHDEQRTVMTLWAIFRSPLMMGGDLPASDEWTTSLLTNPEVIAVDQHTRGNRAVISTDRVAVWVAEPERGEGDYVAVFNLADSEQTIHYAWKDLGLAPGSYRERGLWSGTETAAATELKVVLRPHASALYRLSAK